MQAPEVPVLIIKQQKQNWCTDDNNKMYLAVISFTQAIHSAKSCPFRSITGLSLKCFTMLCQRVEQWGPMTWHWAISQYNEEGPHPQQQKPQHLWKVQQRTWTTSKKSPEYRFAFPFELTRRLKLQSWEAAAGGSEQSLIWAHVLHIIWPEQSLPQDSLWSSLQALELSGLGHFSCHKD